MGSKNKILVKNWYKKIGVKNGFKKQNFGVKNIGTKKFVVKNGFKKQNFDVKKWVQKTKF